MWPCKTKSDDAKEKSKHAGLAHRNVSIGRAFLHAELRTAEKHSKAFYLPRAVPWLD
jgi:hypothetical protein